MQRPSRTWNSRVGGPAGAGGGVPAFGSVDVNAEEIGEDNARQLGGELQQGSVPGGARFDPEAAQPVGQAGRVHRLCRAPARKQPLIALRQVASHSDRRPVGEPLDQFVEWWREHDVILTEPQRDTAVCDVDITARQSNDAGRRLSVEQ